VPMTWTVTNVPEASHILAGLRACNIVFSIGPAFVGGIDLGLILNVPASPSGCNGYLATADAFVDVTTVNGTGICSTAPISFGPPPAAIADRCGRHHAGDRDCPARCLQRQRQRHQRRRQQLAVDQQRHPADLQPAVVSAGSTRPG